MYLKKRYHSNKITQKYNIQINSFKNWVWVIQKYVFINSFLIKSTLLTKR